MGETLKDKLDHWMIKDFDRLLVELKRGAHVRLSKFDDSPAFAYLPNQKDHASRMVPDVVRALIDDNQLVVVQDNWDHAIYALKPAEVAS